MTSPRRSLAVVLSALVVLFVQSTLVGCATEADTVGSSEADTFGAPVDVPGESEEPVSLEDEDLVPVDDSVVIATDVGAEIFTGAANLRTSANLNLRKGAGTTFGVILVIPSGSTVKVLNPTPTNGFLNIEYNGAKGWSSASYLKAVTGGSTGGGSTSGGGTSGGSTNLNGPASPDNAWARSWTAVGFSYYWGAGRWLPSGPTASTKGSCTGSCPNCTHKGMYGADCSGLVGKAWQFGPIPLDVQSHPFSTLDFNKDRAGHWSTISRASLKKGDALVYNTNGSGHIVVYEKGDGWGTPSVAECRGCSYGCVYNARNFTSNFHAIRRAGF